MPTRVIKAPPVPGPEDRLLAFLRTQTEPLTAEQIREAYPFPAERSRIGPALSMLTVRGLVEKTTFKAPRIRVSTTFKVTPEGLAFEGLVRRNAPSTTGEFHRGGKPV